MAKGNGDKKPRILVLEGLSGASSRVKQAGGSVETASPYMANEVLDGFDGDVHGLLLTGGGDVDPRRYGKKPHKEVYGVSETRDAVELFALEWAAELGIPVMGICRGSQIMNVHAGGTLNQHIGGAHHCLHPVNVAPATRLREMAGTGFHVTSLHHQAVGEVGDGFRISARAWDGTPEAIESTDGRCLGLQFHPEMDRGALYSGKLFRWFVLEAAKRAGLPVPAEAPAYTSIYAQQLKTKGGSSWDTTTAWRPTTAVERDAARCSSPVKCSRWCNLCGIQFDTKEDWEDHMDFLHPDPRVATTRASAKPRKQAALPAGNARRKVPAKARRAS